jgi:hypothetical protein
VHVETVGISRRDDDQAVAKREQEVIAIVEGASRRIGAAFDLGRHPVSLCRQYADGIGDVSLNAGELRKASAYFAMAEFVRRSK